MWCPPQGDGGWDRPDLKDLPLPWVENPDPSVPARHGQPAAVAAEADRQQQRLSWVALQHRSQDHPDRRPDHRAGLGHVPEENLEQEPQCGTEGLLCVSATD